MKLHHVSFWTKDIDSMEAFYLKYFSGKILFRHSAGDFNCVFLELCGSFRLELMTRSGLPSAGLEERTGYSHLGVEVASKEEVNRLTEMFLEDRIPVEKNREQYDDGFYESSVRDPDGNIIEIAFVDRGVNPTA